MSNFSLPRWAGPAFLALVAIGVFLVIFRLGTQASAGVALNDPVVWVEDGARGRLLQINGSTREITAQVDVGEDGDSIVALPQGRDAVFLNRTTGVVGVVGAVSLSVDSEEGEPGEAGLTGDAVQLLANHQGQTDWTEAYIVGDLKTLVYEPGNGVRSEIRIPEENGALSDAVVNADGDLVAITGDSGQVVYSTNLGLERLHSLPPLISENAAPPGLVRAGETVYLVDSARRVVNQVDNDGELGEAVPICGSPGDVQIAGNFLSESDGTHRVLVHDALAGLLSVVEPGENECSVIELDETGSNWGAPVAVDGTGYLPNYDTGQILVVDLVDRVVADQFMFRPATGRSFELEVFDGAVWANEPDGFRAAVVTRDEIVAISKLGTVFFGGDGADGSGPGAFAGSDDADGPRVFNDAAPAVVTDGDNDDLNPEDVIVSGGQTAPSADGDGEVVADPGALADDQADPPESTVPPADDTELPDLVDPDIIDPAVQPQAPIDAVVVERVEAEGVIEELDVDELIANFVFSSDTINVGEEVRLSDDSTGIPTEWNWDFGDGTGASGPDVNKIWENEGIFTVKLLVANAEGDLSEQTHDFTVIAENIQRVPSAGFTLSAETVEAGDSVTFTDTSTGDPQSWLWEFGDGSTGTGPEITHTYDEAGIYNVTLTASNAAGPNSVTTQVTVVSSVEPPVAVIASFPGVVEVGQTVTLVSESTNTPTVTSWSFDDGDSALGETVRHAWDTPGEYRIRLSVSNSAGSDETIAVVVVEARVNPPIARFGQTALQVVEGEELLFNDLSLNAPTSLTWDFGDGSTGSGANVAHTWAAPGTYQVTLTATNGAGSDDVSKTVTVDAVAVDPPVAAFTASVSSVQVDAVVVFTDTSTGSPTEWSWNFGDGTGVSTVPNPTHSFDTPGTYTVSLTTTNNGGSDSTTTTIVVIDPPAAAFTSVANELDVAFTDTTVNGPTSWLWNFGDGTTGTLQNPSHTYPAPGAYPVTLIASNAAGDSIPFSTTVTVNKAPTADFTFTAGGLTAQFTNASVDAPTTYAWNFGGSPAGASSLPNPTHTYSASGSYPVTLTVTNAEGSDSITKQVAVTLAPPEAIASCTVVGAGVSCDGSTSLSAVSYSWSSPSAITQSGTTTPNASFTYGASGTYDVTMTVTNVEGTTDSVTTQVTVTVPQPPTVTNVAVSSNNNGVVELAASATESPTSWTWTTPGGTITAGANTSNPTISYATAGPKTVTVDATNGTGTSAPNSTSFTVNISAPPVVTSVSANNIAGTVQLGAVVTNTPVTYLWTTTGGTLSSATAAAPILTVTANGPYTVEVTATNADGTDTGSRTFTVNDILAPPVVAVPTIGTESPAGTVAVSTTATNSPTSWTWSVPGAASSTGTGGANPTFTFTANGTYPGTVTATNAAGTSSVVNFSIPIGGFVVIPMPTAGFTFSQPDPASTVAGFNFSGTAQAGATITWSFTGGTPASGTGAAASSDFLMAGTYSATVTVTDAGGTDTFTGPVVIT